MARYWLSGRKRKAGGSEFGPIFIPEKRAGDALAAWYQIDGPRTNVWVGRYTRDKGWGKAERIENRTSVAFGPLVSADPTGGFILFWKMIDGMNPATSIHSSWARRLR